MPSRPKHRVTEGRRVIRFDRATIGCGRPVAWIATCSALCLQPVAAADELIVRFKAPPTAGELAAICAKTPIASWRPLRYVQHDRATPHALAAVRIATLRPQSDPDTAIAALGGAASVLHAERDVRVELTGEASPDTRERRAPNDPLLPWQWAMERIDGAEAIAAGTGAGATIVAVIDSGINVDHEDFVGSLWTNPGEIPDNGVDDDGNGFVDDYYGWNFAQGNHDLEDNFGHGHGTQVSGVIGARTNNGKGIVGIARTRIMTLLGFNSVHIILEATYYAIDMGADVINYSLGSHVYSEEWENAVRYAADHDVVVVGGAGNDGSDAPFYPAVYSEVMAVAATTRDESLWVDSNFGSWLDVAAPGGVNVLSCGTESPSQYTELGGTSIAAPHVSGLAALLRSVAPSMSARKTRAFIRAGAEDLGETGFDETYGYGRINAARSAALVRRDLGCPADFNHDLVVDFGDLLGLLTGWGSDDWLIDVNDDGEVGFHDVLELLAAWGPCAD